LPQAGDERLGGEDWDEVMLEMVIEGYQERSGVDPRNNKELMQNCVSRPSPPRRRSSAKQAQVNFAMTISSR